MRQAARPIGKPRQRGKTTRVKIAVEMVPRAGEMTPALEDSDKKPCVFISGRGFELTVLGLLLMCAIALSVENLSPAFRFGATAVSTPKTSGGQFVSAIPARVIARPFDGSRPLKPGDLVVVSGLTAPTVRQIAAVPNGTVLLRSGNSLKALYLVGDNSYVVVSRQGISMVRPEEIRATLASVASVASVASF
jgi:hypothetical protein